MVVGTEEDYWSSGPHSIRIKTKKSWIDFNEVVEDTVKEKWVQVGS
jgi:hypothetical protein